MATITRAEKGKARLMGLERKCFIIIIILFKSDKGDAISMDELRIVYTKLYDARNKWFDIGLALDISYSTLESIESEKSDNSDRLRRMLAHCIQSGGPLTWTDLSGCLRHPTVKRNDLANIIDQGLRMLL